MAVAEELGLLAKVHGKGAGDDAGIEAASEAAGWYNPEGEERFLDWCRGFDYGVILLIGAPRMGKTSLMCFLADYWLQQAGELRRWEAYIIGYTEEALAKTPLKRMEWDIDQLIDTFSKTPGNTLLLPDAGRALSNRAFGSNQSEVFGALVEMSGHYHVRILIDVQNSSLIDKRAYDARAMVYKPLGMGAEVSERAGLERRAQIAQDAFTQCRCTHPVRVHDGGSGSCNRHCGCRDFRPVMKPEERARWAYVFCDEIGYNGLVHARKRPDWYTKAFSEAHSDQDLRSMLHLRKTRQAPAAASAEPPEDADFREVSREG